MRSSSKSSIRANGDERVTIEFGTVGDEDGRTCRGEHRPFQGDTGEVVDHGPPGGVDRRGADERPVDMDAGELVQRPRAREEAAVLAQLAPGDDEADVVSDREELVGDGEVAGHDREVASCGELVGERAGRRTDVEGDRFSVGDESGGEARDRPFLLGMFGLTRVVGGVSRSARPQRQCATVSPLDEPAAGEGREVPTDRRLVDAEFRAEPTRFDVAVVVDPAEYGASSLCRDHQMSPRLERGGAIQVGSPIPASWPARARVDDIA